MLHGEVALVTGAGGGIGRAASVALVEAGANVALVGRNESRLAQTRSEAGDQSATRCCVADVTSAAQVASAFESAHHEFGAPVSIVFNAAGATGSVGSLLRESEENFDAVFAVNVKGTWNGLHAALSVMRDAGRGVIVNCASAIGTLGAPGLASYAAAKSAVISLSRSAALEVARYGIRVNVICPGPTETAMLEGLRQQGRGAPERGTGIARGVPSVADADEIARAVLFLVAPDAISVTGSVLTIDGGVSAGRQANPSEPA